MAEHYPASDDIDLDLAEIEELWKNEALLQDAIDRGILSLKKTKAANQNTFDPSIGRELYKPSETPFSHFRKLGPEDSLQSLRVVRVEVYSEDDDEVTTREFNPNDPTPLFEAYRRVLNDPDVPVLQKKGLEGSLTRFSNWRTTSAISLHFDAAMRTVLKQNFLEPSTVKSTVEYKMDEKVSEDYSVQFKMMYPGFYRKYQEVFVAVNNHALIKMAAEKNREYNPITQQPFTSMERAGVTWNKLEEIALQSAAIAFQRTKEIYAVETRYKKDVAFVKTATTRIENDLKSLQAGQADDVNFLKGFLKQSGMKFKVDRENEDSKMAVRRFAREYREFAGKRLDDLEHNRGLQVVLAIAVARMRGNETVGTKDLAEAAKRIQEARKNPGTFTSARRMIDSITGNNQELSGQLMMMLDRRRTFARTYDRVAKFGQTAARVSAGDKRITKAHAEEGKRFAATTFLRSMIKQESIAKSLSWEFKRKGFSAEVLRTNARSTGSERLLNHLRKEMSRDEAQRREKEAQALRSDAPAVLQDSLGNERERDQRPDPDPSPTRDPRPRR
ncbi:hypothetical protein N7645_15020 [Pseudomonas juntendi]|uniref:hypothetical protein n=1 Tax=Pseudomonas TaxID=286 RepID=UPI0012ADEF5F|nr:MULTISPECIES: hypothetical protein [Pseudomonas]MDG9918199.1 hypothetical protein [Pseudomonas juntendi]MDH0507647.1 hypothetical protein [Pseudomonas juntendi]MDH1044871.1 hypothetical protein [Pseudomonas juntendi]MRT62316.1 hypothetical protein [Pseudomonas sp. CAH-1]